AGEPAVELDLELGFDRAKRRDPREAIGHPPDRDAAGRRRDRDDRVPHLDRAAVHHRDDDPAALAGVDEAVAIARAIFLDPDLADADPRADLEALDHALEGDRIAVGRHRAGAGAAAGERVGERHQVGAAVPIAAAAAVA